MENFIYKLKNRYYNSDMTQHKLFGFTLAETLITIGIIGVVAALTIPSIIQNYQEKTTIVKLKKHYSMMQQAYTMAIQENGTADNWSLKANSYNDNENILYYLKPYLKTIKYCGSQNNCWQAPRYNLNKTTAESIGVYKSYSKAIFNDGSIIAARVHETDFSDDIHRWAGYSIDLNGERGPNVYGKDVFNFYFTQNKIIPFGGHNQAYDFDSGWCNPKIAKNSVGCAAWILQNENMDYLHCDGLSWTGKKSCKEK